MATVKDLAEAFDFCEERWKAIHGYDGKYEISDLGRIRSLDRTRTGRCGAPTLVRGQILTPKLARNGYLLIGLRDGKHQTFKTVHRLVLLTFNGPPPTEHHQCAHGDGNKQNNHISNLRWATAKENCADRDRQRKSCHISP